MENGKRVIGIKYIKGSDLTPEVMKGFGLKKGGCIRSKLIEYRNGDKSVEYSKMENELEKIKVFDLIVFNYIDEYTESKVFIKRTETRILCEDVFGYAKWYDLDSIEDLEVYGRAVQRKKGWFDTRKWKFKIYKGVYALFENDDDDDYI